MIELERRLSLELTMRKIESSVNLVQDVHGCTIRQKHGRSAFSPRSSSGDRTDGLKRNKDMMSDKAIRDLAKESVQRQPT